MKEKLLNLEAFLAGRIIGQEHVISDFVAVLKRGELGLADSRRPKGKFLFLGPTGVGKTELALLGCKYIFGDIEKHCIRIDMSEYQSLGSLGLLLGQPGINDGYLGRGYDSSEGKGFLLFDEIEKAYSGVTDLFLQILDAARITLACGRTLDLSQYYVIATSNIGSDIFQLARKSDTGTIERIVRNRVEIELRPEIVGRFDKMMVFRMLQYDSQIIIARNMLVAEVYRLNQLGYEIQWDETVLNFLINKGMRSDLGARPMRVAVSSYVQNSIVDHLLYGAGSFSGRLRVNGEKLEFESI